MHIHDNPKSLGATRYCYFHNSEIHQLIVSHITCQERAALVVAGSDCDRASVGVLKSKQHTTVEKKMMKSEKYFRSKKSQRCAWLGVPVKQESVMLYHNTESKERGGEERRRGNSGGREDWREMRTEEREGEERREENREEIYGIAYHELCIVCQHDSTYVH